MKHSSYLDGPWAAEQQTCEQRSPQVLLPPRLRHSSPSGSPPAALPLEPSLPACSRSLAAPPSACLVPLPRPSCLCPAVCRWSRLSAPRLTIPETAPPSSWPVPPSEHPNQVTTRSRIPHGGTGPLGLLLSPCLLGRCPDSHLVLPVGGLLGDAPVSPPPPAGRVCWPRGSLLRKTVRGERHVRVPKSLSHRLRSRLLAPFGSDGSQGPGAPLTQ